jgi:hypothetical protein
MAATPEEPPRPRVVVVGFEISFWDLVKFMLRVALAAVPAWLLFKNRSGRVTHNGSVSLVCLVAHRERPRRPLSRVLKKKPRSADKERCGFLSLLQRPAAFVLTRVSGTRDVLPEAQNERFRRHSTRF